MEKRELLELLAEIEDDGNVDEILKDTDLYKSALNFENIKPLFASNDDFKSFLDSEKDKHADKALKTWKANNLDKIIQSEILKATQVKETPEQKAIRELEAKLDAMSKEKERAERQAKYKDILAKKKIPSDLTDFILGEDDEVTDSNITRFEDAMKTYIEEKVAAKLKESAYVPPKSDSKKLIKKDDFKKMSLMEKQKLFNENPELYRELSGR